MKRVASYIRRSDDKQKDSPERQRLMIGEFLKRKGWTLNREFPDIDGRNSRDLAYKRKEFQALLKAVQNDEFDAVVIDTQDRFGAADDIEFKHYLHIFRQHDCELWSCDSSQGEKGLLTSGEVGSLIITTVASSKSAAELHDYGKRQVSGKRVLAQRGDWQGGYVPYGFDVICLNTTSGNEVWRVVIKRMVPTQGIWERIIVHPDGRQERADGKDVFPTRQSWERLVLAPSVIEERRETIQRIFSMFASGAWSIRGLCTLLNQQHVDPVYGEGWYPTRLKPLLMNPVYYVGQTVWGKRSHGKNAWFVGGEYLIPPRKQGKPLTARPNKKDDWVFPPPDTALISEELFKEVQTRLGGIKTKGRAIRDENLWLSGLLYCGHCGMKMTGWSNQGYHYACQTYRKFGKNNPKGCRLHRTPHDLIESYLVRYLEELGPELRDILEARENPSALPSATEKEHALLEGDLESLYIRMVAFIREREANFSDGDCQDVFAVYQAYFVKAKVEIEKELVQAEHDLRKAVADLRLIPAEAGNAI